MPQTKRPRTKQGAGTKKKQRKTAPKGNAAAIKKRNCLQGTMRFTMEQYKRGTLVASDKKKVTSRKQALAIGFERANQACGRIPKQTRRPTKKATLIVARKVGGNPARPKKSQRVTRAPATKTKLVPKTVIVRHNGRLEKRVVYVRPTQ